MESLYLQCFGTPQLTFDEQSIAITRRKGLALVVYLALTQQKHSRNTLATLLWSESTHAGALASLRTTLAELRKTLLEEILLIEGNTLQLKPIASDVLQFRSIMNQYLVKDFRVLDNQQGVPQLEKVVRLYQDTFLKGFNLVGCEDFHRWQQFIIAFVRQNVMLSLHKILSNSLGQPHIHKVNTIDP